MEMTDTERTFRLELHRAEHGPRPLWEGEWLDRPLVITPFAGNYGQAGLVLVVNGSPPVGIVMVIEHSGAHDCEVYHLPRGIKRGPYRARPPLHRAVCDLVTERGLWRPDPVGHPAREG